MDQDSAGIEAIKRSIPVLEKRSLTTTVVVAPDKDPDESLKNNPVAFKIAVKNAAEVYDFMIEKAIKENDPKTAEGKKKITDQILPLLSLVQNEIVKEHYLKKLSQEIDTSFESLLKQIDKKNEEPEKKITNQKVKIERREMLEEYLLGLIVS